ncbi:PRC-barrel domain-containing protein [Pseudooceanicola aestuarii]|uniref:PRC-barrel domain-containing protein n=1 Tax=Pseudooceanicola aestuarii TaxID=2697319 RepID=UPI0013D37694|nr:PRC-barrel domain-containing protein [Pseudooceanicola aestuarii]
MNLFQTTSRAALVALIAAAPLAAHAQDATQTDPQAEETLPQQTEGTETGGASGDFPTEQAQTAPGDQTGATDEAGSDMAADDATTEDADVAADADAEVTDDGADATATADAESTAPAADTGTDMGADTGMAADSGLTDPAADPAAEGTDMAATEEPAKPVEGQITMQDADTMLVNDLLGASVYNGQDENVGDINDLIVGLDGSVEGVVIGVGGFLGLGEKNVAVQMSSLSVVDAESGAPRLMTSATEADLEAAPEFVTAEEQRDAAEQQRLQNDTGMDNGMTGTTAPVE